MPRSVCVVIGPFCGSKPVWAENGGCAGTVTGWLPCGTMKRTLSPVVP